MRTRSLGGFGLILLLVAGCTASPSIPEQNRGATAATVLNQGAAGESLTDIGGGADRDATTSSDSSAARGGGAIGSGN